MSTPRKKSIYSVHPGVLMTQKWIIELKQKTGRSLQEWLAYIKKSGPKGEEERRAWLKEEHGLGTNTAWWLAERAAGKGEESGDPDLYLAAAERDVEKMFSGGKAKLRPLYDALLKLGLKTGKEAKACPCSTIVPLYRNHVFAQIKPTTQTRIDLGFALGDMKPAPDRHRRLRQKGSHHSPHSDHFNGRYQRRGNTLAQSRLRPRRLML